MINDKKQEEEEINTQLLDQSSKNLSKIPNLLKFNKVRVLKLSFNYIS